MNTIARLIGILRISVAVLCLYTQAVADSLAPPLDFTKLSENQEYLFVMLAPGEGAERNLEIRKIYKQSGLYRNDGTSTPLWTVDWYAFEVFPSSDGEHLIRMGPWASSTEQLAVVFYRNGKKTRSYQIKDLVRDEAKLVHTVSHFFWRSELKYDDKQTVLLLTTTDNQTYRFSAATGEILP